jgi:hypothetical protein
MKGRQGKGEEKKDSEVKKERRETETRKKQIGRK